jgi:hypothetical protein
MATSLNSPSVDDKAVDYSLNGEKFALDDIPSNSRPAWKAYLKGSVTVEHETKRALDSRHIMMIGKYLSRRCYAL